jgi:quinol monooxygenase YgiN
MSVNLLINFNVRQDRLTSFTDLMKSVKTALPAVPGCQGVKIYNDVGNPLVFTLVETWDSAEIHGKHVRSLQESGQWASVAAHLSADPVSAYYQEI